MPASREQIDEICDLCWDDSGREVKAVTVTAGVPLCEAHSKDISVNRFNGKPVHVDPGPPKRIDKTGVMEVLDDEDVKPIVKTANYQVFDRTKKMITSKQDNPSGDPKNRLSVKAHVNGIQDVDNFCDFMSAVMFDLVEGRIDPATANAVCNASSKFLQAVEMQLRHGGSGKFLKLIDGK